MDKKRSKKAKGRKNARPREKVPFYEVLELLDACSPGLELAARWKGQPVRVAAKELAAMALAGDEQVEGYLWWLLGAAEDQFGSDLATEIMYGPDGLQKSTPRLLGRSFPKDMEKLAAEMISAVQWLKKAGLVLAPDGFLAVPSREGGEEYERMFWDIRDALRYLEE